MSQPVDAPAVMGSVSHHHAFPLWWASKLSQSKAFLSAQVSGIAVRRGEHSQVHAQQSFTWNSGPTSQSASEFPLEATRGEPESKSESRSSRSLLDSMSSSCLEGEAYPSAYMTGIRELVSYHSNEWVLPSPGQLAPAEMLAYAILHYYNYTHYSSFCS